MKVLLVNRYHHPMGGSETVYFNTARLLESKGHDVSFFAMDYPENLPSRQKDFFTKAFDFNSLSLKGKIKNFKNFFYNGDARVKLEQLIDEVKPDIAHIHLFYGSLTSSILVALKKKGIPVVITAHDYRLICPAYIFLDGNNKICEKCKGQKFFHCALNKCAKKSYFVSTLFALEAYYRNIFYPPKSYIDNIAFVSDFSMKKHLQYRPDLKDKAVQLYNFTPKRSTKNIVPDKGEYFLYLGRISSEKGILNLVNAFNERPGLKLIIAGAGPLLDEVLKKKNDNIEYRGFVQGAELKGLVLDSSFVVVPSECYETLGMSAVEALALGKPVIAAKIGGLPEVVTHEKNGFLFDAFSLDGLLNILDRANAIPAKEYRALCERALLTEGEKFDEESHYEQLMEIYKSAIKNHHAQ
ncbi:MAG TPA: glycosyltransferase [Mucilaginibacter sp.]|nr:glycosyltransferase [Mucilaginibacter sp.]